MRPIAIVGWLSILGALLGWQGLGLVRGPEWRTLSDFLRDSSPPSFTDCEAGAMPPFGNLYDVAVYVDRSLGRNERIVFQAGTHPDHEASRTRTSSAWCVPPSPPSS